MKNNIQSNNFINPNKNDIKMTNPENFDIFIKSLLNHTKPKQNRNKQSSIVSNKIFQTMEIHNNSNNNNIKLKKTEQKEIKKRNKDSLFSTFSKKNFLTLDQLIELKTKNINNNQIKNFIKRKNKYNSISNIKTFDKNEILNKTSEKIKHFNSNYNLLLVQKLNSIKKKGKFRQSVANIKKINHKKNKSRSIINYSDNKLFNTYDNKNSIFSLNNEYNNDNKNFGDIILNLKNTLKQIENEEDNGNKKNHYKINKISNKSKVNKLLDIHNKNNRKIKKNLNIGINNAKNNNFKNINKKDINNINKKDYNNRKNKNDSNNYIKTNIPIKIDKIENFNKISNTEICHYKYKKNYSFPYGLNALKVRREKNKIENNEQKINKSNITMNNNYIFNNFQNKYELTNFFQKKDKLKNIYSLTDNNNKDNLNYNDLTNDKYYKNEIIKNGYISKLTSNSKTEKNKIIKAHSFFYKKERNNKINIKLNSIKYINKKIINFFTKIINVYKNLLLNQKKKEQILLKQINQKNNEIKKLKYSYLKMIYFFKNEINTSYLKDFIIKKILIEKQLITENNYLRSLILSKNNLFQNFYSSYEASYEGFFETMEKGFENNKIKNNNQNFKKDTANNSPQKTNREDFNNEGLLFLNRKKKIFRNYYILKKNKRENY